MRRMLAVLKPGMLETEVSKWGHFIGLQLSSEEMGLDVMVTANETNRTLMGKALNKPIHEVYCPYNNIAGCCCKRYYELLNDVIIPGMDYVVVEKTPGKYGKEVKVLTELPANLQEFVGKV